MNERYTRFIPHEDNVEEIISAEHVNELQDRIQKNQDELFAQGDTDFLDRAIFVLDNHPIVNVLYVDTIRDPSKVDIPASTNLSFNTEESSISFDGTGATSGLLVGKEYVNPNNTAIKEIIFMADTYVPQGAGIRFEISNNGVDFYPIEPNESEVYTMPTTGTKIQIRAQFVRTDSSITSPLIKAYSVLYRDPKYTVSIFDDLPPDPTGGNGAVIVPLP